MSDISEEILASLSKIMEMNERILSEEPDETIREYAYEIEDARKRLSSLLKEALQLPMGEKDIQKEKRESYNLYELIEEMVSILQSESDKKRIRACFQIEEDLPQILCGDEIKIRQVLLQIILYALKHTQRGRITFSVQGRQSDRGEFFIRFAVADTGDGIPMEDQLLEEVLEQIGGELKVQSVREKGSILFVKIPQEVFLWNAEESSDKEPFHTEESFAGKEAFHEEETSQKGAESLPKVQIDKTVGIAYCDGNEEIYQEVLQVYVEQGEKYSSDLMEFYRKKDWKSYEILVHAIKSNSKSIGAEALSEEAKEQETAAREKREDLIEEGCKRLYEDYQKVLREAEGLLEIKEEESEEEVFKEEVTREDYLQECQCLLVHIRAYEMNEVAEQIEKMKKMYAKGSTSKETGARLQQIMDAVDAFDYDSAEECLLEWIGTQEA